MKLYNCLQLIWNNDKNIQISIVCDFLKKQIIYTSMASEYEQPHKQQLKLTQRQNRTHRNVEQVD